jgi:SAM-dependent methyltransferase
MARAHYASLVKRSNYASESFTVSNGQELVVGWYAEHEAYDYERWLFDGIEISTTAVALDFGCGPGRMIRRLARRFSRVDGVDISPEVIEVARMRCAHLDAPPRLFVTDGQSVPDELADTYDVAFSVICLQHICVYSIRRRILDGLFRSLKPGGLLSFQMGYGPGHRAMIDYFGEYVAAEATNGSADVTILHPSELATDLADIGFASAEFTLRPTGPGDTHGAWIFVRTLKPGLSDLVSMSPNRSAAAGFSPLIRDAGAAERARRTYMEHGIPRRRRHLEKQIATLGQDLERLRTELAAATGVPEAGR